MEEFVMLGWDVLQHQNQGVATSKVVVEQREGEEHYNLF
jgi:hypothetical protein